jgi:squalene-hopene/tetraprenyl-beta-curcumene cyclase
MRSGQSQAPFKGRATDAQNGYSSKPSSGGSGAENHFDDRFAYLQREQPDQPLHNLLALLWASSKLPAALSTPLRQPLIDEILRAQQTDGGWTIASLGPWRPHPNAPPSHGSNSFATAYVAFILQEAGVGRSHPSMVRALDWLKKHQDSETGSWAADSLNERYEPDSMQIHFMQDAATAFATLALLHK